MPSKRKRESTQSPRSSKIKTEDDGSGNSKASTPSIAPSKRPKLDRLLKRAAMFKNQLTQKTDFTIVCQDYHIKVHSMLLSCRSEVFDAMFSSNFIESLEHQVLMDDCQPEDLIEFLKYFYPKLAPKQKLRRGNVAQILYLAEKYQVEEVKSKCHHSIEKISSKERSVARVMPWLKIAFDYNMVDLQRRIVLKISKAFPDFDRTPTYKALPDKLKLELMKYSKIVLKERMDRIREIVYDEVRSINGNASETSSHTRSYKSRVIDVQALISGWEDGDSSNDIDEPGIDSDNVESDPESEND